MAHKSGKKTGKMRSPRNGAEAPTGAHPGNTGGKKGRSGRKPDEFKAWARDAVSDDSARNKLLIVMRQPAHRHFSSVWRMVLEYAEGKPPASLELTGKNGAAMEFEDVTRQREQLRNRIERLAERE